MEENTPQGTSHELDGKPEDLRDSVKPECELRLVLLGWAGTGKSTLGNAILGYPVFDTRYGSTSQKPVTMKCEKGCATVAGRQVVVVDTPDWFYSERPLEEVHRQLDLCKSLAAPGPHAFLLCISVHHQCENHQALDALEKVFGLKAITQHTIVLFTNTDHLSEGQTLKEYLDTEQKDLLDVVQRCDDRYHVIRVEGEKEEVKDRKSVEELLEKVEQMVKESGEEYYTCPPHLPTDDEESIVDPCNVEGLSNEIGSRWKDEAEFNVDADVEPEASEEKTEESADDPVTEEDIALSPPAPPPSFLRWIWDSVVGWVLWLPSLIRGTTLLGSFVGLFFGGVMGATVGSIATEVGRRKNKEKVKSN